MLVPYFEILRDQCESSYYDPFTFDHECLLLTLRHITHERTQYLLNTETMFVRVYVWDFDAEDWSEVGGAPLVKMGADLVKRIEYAHTTARANDYWL